MRRERREGAGEGWNGRTEGMTVYCAVCTSVQFGHCTGLVGKRGTREKECDQFRVHGLG